MSKNSSDSDFGLMCIALVILYIFTHGDPDIMDGLIKVLNR